MENQDKTTSDGSMEAREKWFTLKQKIALVLSVNAFAVLSVLFFAPIEVYLGNIVEFSFPFDNVWWLLLVCSLLIVAVTGAVECLLPDKIFLGANLAVFGGGLCCYIQAMFLNGKMSTLTGGSQMYDKSVVLINLVIWLLILAVIAILAVALIKRGQRKIVVTGVKFVSLALVAMQTVALVSLLPGTDSASSEESDYLTTKGEFQLAQGKNVVVFILDTCDLTYVNNALKKYPDLMEGMKGFTYYPNAVSTHSRTYPSIPYLLTGEVCYFDIPYNDYINKAYTDSGFLPAIHEAGGDIRIFTENAYVSSAISDKVSNSTRVSRRDLSVISVPNLIKQMLKVSLYREAPYAVKPRFQYEISAINGAVINLEDGFISENDALFYAQFQEKGLTVTDEYPAAFRFYHLNGAHAGFNIDQYAQPTNPGDIASAIRGDFYIIEDYIQQMQEQGIYEDSTIIITADHGFSSTDDVKTLQVQEAACPLLLVKEAGKGMEDSLEASEAPVGHADLFPTILAGFGLDYEEYGRPIYEIPENEQRERLYYFSAFVSDEEGEVALREYRITGDARNIENWELTGRYWDILYSQRDVSKRKLADILNQAGQ